MFEEHDEFLICSKVKDELYLVRSGSIWLRLAQHEECHERQSVERPDEEASELYQTDDITRNDEEQCEQALETQDIYG